ncbi:MAG: hypothetical protein ACE5IR_28575 [bacterium]
MYKKLLILLPLLVLGCAPQGLLIHFMKVGDKQYPPKPKDYEVLVFINDERPQREYEVIGIVLVEADYERWFLQKTSDQEVLNRLKKEARKHGADALIDVKIALRDKPDPDASLSFLDGKLMKQAEAMAIVFIDNQQKK